MDYGYLIVYKKPNGKIIYRGSSSYNTARVGDYNHFGWEVIDIKRLYKGKTYSSEEYNNLLSRKRKFNDFVSVITNINIKKLIEIFVLLLLIKFYI